MDLVIQQIAVLLVFAVVLLFLNLKARTSWLKFLSLWTMIACLAGAGYLTVDWIFL